MNGLRFVCEGGLGHDGRLFDQEGHELSGCVQAVTLHAEAGEIVTADVRAIATSVAVDAQLQQLTVVLPDGRAKTFRFPVVNPRLAESLKNILQAEPPGGLENRLALLGTWLLGNEASLRAVLGVETP